jgi:serine/threonine-protein kinase
VSPHNILVGTDGIGRLTDFGVAKADVRMASTRAGQFKGKLSYMAPEQASSSETDQRSDLFSVGIILWESLTGRRLFRGDSNAATLNKLLNHTVVKPSSVSPELERFDEVVMKALSRNPEQRFQSADEFGEALDAAAGRGGVAKTRDVAEVVRALDAEKLHDERQRVRAAIELLGRAEFARSKVPMPRDGGTGGSRTYTREDGPVPELEGSASGVIRETTAVTPPASSAPDALKWLVMVLAVAVFLYAGFLVWQLLQAPNRPAAGVSEPPARIEPVTVSPPAAEPSAEARRPAELPAEPPPTKPASAKQAPEPKSKPTAAGSRRRRSGARNRTAAKRPAAPKSPADPPQTPPPIDPVDIDIQNPYRN